MASFFLEPEADGGSEVAVGFAFVSSSVFQRPGEQSSFTEVDVALVEPLYAVGLIVDVVCHVFQVLQVRPWQETQKGRQSG